jgi:hypothetical protein
MLLGVGVGGRFGLVRGFDGREIDGRVYMDEEVDVYNMIARRTLDMGNKLLSKATTE